MKFTKGKKFKIMQITDIQEIPAVSPDTLALLEAAVEAEKPDLVVYTGDQIKGYIVGQLSRQKSKPFLMNQYQIARSPLTPQHLCHFLGGFIKHRRVILGCRWNISDC